MLCIIQKFQMCIRDSIKTGDDMSVVPYILLMATAGGYIALQRRNKED